MGDFHSIPFLSFSARKRSWCLDPSGKAIRNVAGIRCGTASIFQQAIWRDTPAVVCSRRAIITLRAIQSLLGKNLLQPITLRGAFCAVFDHLSDFGCRTWCLHYPVTGHARKAEWRRVRVAGAIPEKVKRQQFCETPKTSMVLRSRDSHPLWLCIRPGFGCEYAVVITRTQPVDSCITSARMNRSSIPLSAPTDWIADFILAISSSELSGTPHCAHETCISGLFASNLPLTLVSKSAWKLPIGLHLIESDPLFCRRPSCSH